MSENGDQTTQPVLRPAKRKLLRKCPDRDDIFSYQGQMVLSFKAKQVKVVDSDSSESEDDDEAFHRVQAEKCEEKDSKRIESDSDEEDSDM